MSFPYDLNNIQEKHRKFVVAMGWDNTKTPLEAVALIHEEAAELGHELRNREVNAEAISHELADIILRVVDLASELNIDIQQAVIDKLYYNHTHIEEYKAKKNRRL